MTVSSLKRVLIMAGGTGGHVFPGIAVATYLRDRGIEVHWLGTAHGLEARVVPEAGFPLHTISVHGVRGNGIKTLLLAPIQILCALLQAFRLIRQIQPDVVIGMGGFASGPGGLAAWLSGCPLIIHEQNAIPGLTNKALAFFAKRVLTGFPNVFSAGKKVLAIGNPVRTEIANLPPPVTRLTPPRTPLHLLVIGGSLGAQALNEKVPAALQQLPADLRPTVIHQTGDKHFEAVKSYYLSRGLQADVQPFIKNMATAYAWADVVLCRAGALTVAELCAAGLGAVLVPYPYAVDDHQTANAQFMVKSGAAICIPQTELTEDCLAAIVKQFVETPHECLTMAQAAYTLRQIDATEKIFAICQEVCR